MGDHKPILLVGATGNFGKRLLRNLMRLEGVQLLAASRDLAKAAQLVEQVKAETGCQTVEAVAFARDRDADAQLARLKPWLVIDASGPFQGADYAFAKAVLDAGAHYVDLADATDFLVGFAGAVDALARSQGLVARTGASSTPALSFAVVRELTQNWKRVDTIDIAIVPDGVGEVGESATRGVLTYAGTDVAQFRHGRIDVAKGWLGHEDLFVPGLPRRRVAPVETLDAIDMPGRFRVASRVRFLAGLESRLEMGGLRFLSWLRSQGLVSDLRSLARFLAKGRVMTRVTGTHTGGMMVRMTGLDAQGQWVLSQWSLVARDGSGPNVPGLPAVVATQLLRDGKLETGARLADDVPLAGIMRALAHHPIHVEVRVRSGTSPFDRLDLSALPKAVQGFHRLEAPVEWQGQAEVARGRNVVSRVVGWIMGLPDAAADVPVHVSVERRDDGAEQWTRMFGASRFSSVMKCGADGLVWEQFGPLNFALGLKVQEGRLVYPILKGRLFGIPIPRFLLPSSEAFESEDAEGRFRFDVRLGLPVFGLLVHYQGWLVPKA